MSVAVHVRFYPVEAAVLHYYAREFESDPRRIARGMLKRSVASDRALDTKALTTLLSDVPELQDKPALLEDARADLKALIAKRAGKPTAHASSTVTTRQTNQDPLDGGDCAFTVTALEFLLLTYYARRENCTREQVLRRFLRKYVLADTNFDFARFRRFVSSDIVPQLDAKRVQQLSHQLKAFFLPRERRDHGQI